MSLSDLDHFYMQKEEPHKSCLLVLREIILSLDKDISAAWKYGMPFFCYKGKMFCYLWVHKQYKQPYIGLVEGKQMQHAQLLLEKRARMKILLVDATKDIPVKVVKTIVKEALKLTKAKMKP
jgi:hypothetical protein